MSALVFLDTETTGLSLDDDIWEFGAIRREEDGSETELHLFIEHSRDKCRRLPESFYNDHIGRYLDHRAVSRRDACLAIKQLFGDDRPHVVGAVPNFDTERLRLMFAAEWPHWSSREPWHYHLIDVENLSVGYLYGLRVGGFKAPTLPWDSDALSRAVGVEPPTDERHTAMGDVRWCMALYDAITQGARW